MKISNAKVNHVTNPIGYKMDNFVFSWVLEEAGSLDPFSADYRIIISNGDSVVDTGYKKLNPLACKIDVDLNPRTRYTWKLCVKDSDGLEQCFDAGFFETGKMNEAWQGKWITCNMSIDRHPVFERDFLSDKKVTKARLYVAGLRPIEDEPGFKRVTISPKLNYKLGKVDASYPSSAGTYTIHWDIPDLNTVNTKIAIPAGCSAKVTLPKISEKDLLEEYGDNALVKAMQNGFVTAGEYEITYKTKEPLARIFTIEDTLNDIWCDPFASKVLQRVYPKIYEYILWFRRMQLKVVLDNHGEGNDEIYKKLNDAFYEDAIRR